MTTADLRDALLTRMEQRESWHVHDGRREDFAARLDAIIAAAHMETDSTLRAENERLEREVASLAADLAVFTTEPGVLARVGSEHTTYWYNQTRLRDAENERLRRAMSKADGLAKTAYGCLTDAQPAEGDDDISAAMDALDRIRDVLGLPTPEAWDPRNRGIPEFQPAAPTPEAVALLALAIEREHSLPILRGIDSTEAWAQEKAERILTYPPLAAALETDSILRAEVERLRAFVQTLADAPLLMPTGRCCSFPPSMHGFWKDGGEPEHEFDPEPGSGIVIVRRSDARATLAPEPEGGTR